MKYFNETGGKKQNELEPPHVGSYLFNTGEPGVASNAG
jgi:hypothetical protein